jgi:hypothetical protein
MDVSVSVTGYHFIKGGQDSDNEKYRLAEKRPHKKLCFLWLFKHTSRLLKT